MKKTICLCFILSVILAFSACSPRSLINSTQTTKPTTAPFTLNLGADGVGIVPGVEQTSSDVTSGNVYYSDSYIASELRSFFLETVLSSQKKGTKNTVCKWTASLKYYVKGIMTRDDEKSIQEIVDILNDTEGFPGISKADSADNANVTVTFAKGDDIADMFSSSDAAATGGAGIFQCDDSSGTIYSASIGIAYDAKSDVRKAAITREFMRICGASYTSEIYEQSIFYPGSMITEPDEVDMILMDLLYSPKLMNGTSYLDTFVILDELLS